MNMESRRKQRGHLKGKLTTIKNFIIKAKDTDTASEEVAARLQAAEEIYAKFQHISQQLLTMDDEPDSRDQSEDSEFDKRYYTTKAALLQLAEKLRPQSAGPSAGSSAGTSMESSGGSAGGSTSEAAMMQILE